MFRCIGIAAAAAIFSLSACTPGQSVSQGPAGSSAPVPATGMRTVQPDKDCGGTNGVTVTPCPVRLTNHTKRGIVVTVNGPGVVKSSLGDINSCFSGHLCYYALRQGNSQTRWRMTSGRACGRADVEFDGEDASGTIVGYFFLKVANRYCP